MNESAVQFGADANLIGILSQPTMAAEGAAGDVAFLLLNAGIIHRIGPHRINVKLARRLAQHGISSLRFDLAGLGDSRPARAGAPFEQQAVLDIRAAMDYLQQTTGTKRFALIGICSGADNGFATALEDPRIVGLAMFDAYAYPTIKTRWVRYRHRIHQRGLWRAGSGWIRRRVKEYAAKFTALFKQEVGTAGSARLGEIGLTPPRYTRAVPPRETFAKGLQALDDRTVALYLIYSGSLIETYNYPKQFRDAFSRYRFKAQIRCEFLPQIDHAITGLAAQQLLIDRIADWAGGVGQRRGQSVLESARPMPPHGFAAMLSRK